MDVGAALMTPVHEDASELAPSADWRHQCRPYIHQEILDYFVKARFKERQSCLTMFASCEQKSVKLI